MTKKAFDQIAEGMRDALLLIESGIFDRHPDDVGFTLENWDWNVVNRDMHGEITGGISINHPSSKFFFARISSDDIGYNADLKEGDLISHDGETFRLGKRRRIY